MKTLCLVAIFCFLGYSQALSHDDIKGFMGKVENVIKCVINSHDDLDDLEDLIEKVESLDIKNGKIAETRKTIGDFLKAEGIAFDDSKGLFALAVDVFNGVKKAYQEGKDDEIMDFVVGLLEIIPEGGIDEAFKIAKGFMEKENVAHCLNAKRALNIGARKDLSRLMQLLQQALLRKRK